MKVYLVQKSWGSFDDYGTRIDKVFIDKAKAEDYVKKYNKELKKKVKQYHKCQDCMIHYDGSVDEIKANCKIADIVVDTEYYDYTYCKAEMNYYRSEDLHQAGLIEMETEDDK